MIAEIWSGENESARPLYRNLTSKIPAGKGLIKIKEKNVLHLEGISPSNYPLKIDFVWFN